eukprot:TRINITY_DN7090_c0_g2_i1.p1 TRINITY_DN7090_c0_g2~~TRINITY_DN7090_c0_g2_i1.p1  ORF type:complete len:439 (-),score=44.34 TRINITY_DN7090_c0_g2_i1:125-1441(-)
MGVSKESSPSNKGLQIRWRPFPWTYFPDQVAKAQGSAEIAFIAPLMAILIGIVVSWFEACMWIIKQPFMAGLRVSVPEFVRSLSRPLGKIMLRDERNHPYLPWMLVTGVFTPALFCWALYRHVNYGFEFSTLLIYHVLRLGPRFRHFSHAHVLAHKEGHCHTGLFKPAFKPLDFICEWWIGPFYGIVPNSYSVAHNKIHHRWHNDVDDVHTNLDLDRTKLESFLIYVPRFTFYWTGLSPLALLSKRREWFLAAKLLAGQVGYYGTTWLMFRWQPLFTTIYWIFVHTEAIVFLCAISYLWHAFVEPDDPNNQYVNSVTILEGHDNVFEEDYHVVHHHSPATHWTDYPAHYQKNIEHYAKVHATIFRDTEEGMLLKWLFENDWDKMAEHFVDLNGKMTHAEKKALIIRRLTHTIGEKGRDGKRMANRQWGSSDTIRNYAD